MGGFSPSISPENLYTRVGRAAAPLIIDVRRADDVAAATAMIVGAVRRQVSPRRLIRLVRGGRGADIVESGVRVA